MSAFQKQSRVIARSEILNAALVTVIFAAAFFVVITISAGCASSKSAINFADAPDNEQCNYMRESCAEADRFQARFDSMDREEREDARAVLQGFINQCASMQELCAATMTEAR